MCEGWGPFLTQAYALSDENLKLKLELKQKEKEIKALTEQIRYFGYLSEQNHFDLREKFCEYRVRVKMLLQSQTDFINDGFYSTSKEQSMKIDALGHYILFYRASIAFQISETDKIEGLQKRMYISDAKQMLSEILPKESFHIEVKALSDIFIKSEEHREKIKKSVLAAKELRGVKLKAGGILLQNDCVCVVFEAINQDNHDTIQKAAHDFDKFDFSLQPITICCPLAYIRPGQYNLEQCRVLTDTIIEMNQQVQQDLITVDCESLEFLQFCVRRSVPG